MIEIPWNFVAAEEPHPTDILITPSKGGQIGSVFYSNTFSTAGDLNE